MDSTTPFPEVMLLRAARVYAARGWPLLPLHLPLATGCTCGRQTCSNRGKHPRTLHGVRDASSDQDVITAWWRAEPLSNVGIATGAASGLVVLDVDPHHGGKDSLQLLEECFFPLPDTLGVATGGGGSHFYFLAPTEGAIPNKVGVAGLPGLDVRADGGFIRRAREDPSPSGDRDESALPLDSVSRFVLQSLYEAVNGIPLNTRGQDLAGCHEQTKWYRAYRHAGTLDS